jgi:hypothetical protein
MEKQRIEVYCDSLLRDPALDPIRSKLGVPGPEGATFEMLTNRSRPTETERAAIAVLAKAERDCTKEELSTKRRFSPPISPQFLVLEEAVSRRFQFLLADLHGGLLTYGEFTRRRQELAVELNAKVQEVHELLAQGTTEAAHRAQQIANEAREAAALEEQAAAQGRLEGRRTQPHNCTTTYLRGVARTVCD